VENVEGTLTQGRAIRATLGNESKWGFNRNAVVADASSTNSIPNVFLVPLHLVLAQQRPQLVLKIHLLVMLFLRGDVLLYLFEIGLAYGNRRVPALPFKAREVATAFLQPRIRDAFHFLHPFRLCDGAPEPRQHMHMILHAADLDGGAFQLFGNAAKIRV